jgi:hypothetical protein
MSDTTVKDEISLKEIDTTLEYIVSEMKTSKQAKEEWYQTYNALIDLKFKIVGIGE